ncbi:MAG: AAA family ATPase [Promethearchaeota archaeon]
MTAKKAAKSAAKRTTKEAAKKVAKLAKVTKKAGAAAASARENAIRLPAEVRHARELAALAQNDEGEPPEGWALSPKMVEKFIVGGEEVEYEDPATGNEERVLVTPKFVGSKLLVRKAIVSLMSDRALLLVGPPGTAKSWLSEHLAAAVCGDSTRVIQGTAGTTEDQVKYSWNYALLIARGPSMKALVPSPLLQCLQEGKVCRFEELTRVPQEVQDCLISVLSEKNLVVPELGRMFYAKRGFNLVATANTFDKGINEMSAALKRRFNFVRVDPLGDVDREVELVQERTNQLLEEQGVRVELDRGLVELLVTVFVELRNGATLDGTVKLRRPTTSPSTAEEISVLFHGSLHAASFGRGDTPKVEPKHLVSALGGALVKDDEGDAEVVGEYFDLVARRRADQKLWKELYEARRRLS